MTATPQQIWDVYRKDATQDMWDYSPFLRMNARGQILEIGVRGGVSTSAFLLGLEEHGGHLVSIDINPRCAELFDHPQWSFIHGNSQDLEVVRAGFRKFASKLHFPERDDPEFDIVFIDGAHYRDGIRSDLRNFGPLVKPKGLILVHDIFGLKDPTPDQIRGDWATLAVGEEYHAFADSRGWPTIDLPGQWGMGIIVRSDW